MQALILAAMASLGLYVGGQHRRSPGLVILACCALPLAAALLSLADPGYMARNAPDGDRYVEQISVLRSSGLAELSNGHVASGKELFPILLVPLSFLFEPTAGLVAVVNATFASAGFLVAQPRLRPNHPLALRLARYYPFFSASCWFFLILPLREGAVLFFLVLCLRDLGERRKIVRRVTTLMALVFLRPVVAVCAALSIVVVELRWKRLFRRPAIAAGGGVLLVVLVALPPIRSQILGVDPARIAGDRNFNANISASALPLADGSSWAALAAGMPRDLANVWLRPNPVLDRSLFVLASLDTVALLYLMRATVRSRKFALRSGASGTNDALQRATYAIWFSCLMAVSYALTVGDLGQLLRGRLAVLLVLWHSQLYESESPGHASSSCLPADRLRSDDGGEIAGFGPDGDGPRGDDSRAESGLLPGTVGRRPEGPRQPGVEGAGRNRASRNRAGRNRAGRNRAEGFRRHRAEARRQHRPELAAVGAADR